MTAWHPFRSRRACRTANRDWPSDRATKPRMGLVSTSSDARLPAPTGTPAVTIAAETADACPVAPGSAHSAKDRAGRLSQLGNRELSGDDE